MAYLIEVLVEIVSELDEKLMDHRPRERDAHQAAVQALTVPSAPLPNFSRFHDVFRGAGRKTAAVAGTVAECTTREGDMRRAFFTAYNDELCEYLMPEVVGRRLADGRMSALTGR